METIKQECRSQKLSVFICLYLLQAAISYPLAPGVFQEYWISPQTDKPSLARQRAGGRRELLVVSCYLVFVS